MFTRCQSVWYGNDYFSECDVAVADDDLVTAARGAWDDVLPGLRLVQ